MTFDDYYAQQAGSGAYAGPLWQEGGSIKGFAGRQFQYGNGLGTFGRTLYRWAKPILKYLGREGLKTGVSIGQDILEEKDIKDSVAKRIKESGANIATDAAVAVRKKLIGRGRKRKGKRKVKRKAKKMARRRRTTRTRRHKKPVLRRKGTVRRRRSRRKRVKRALADIFA